ncbi:MAG: hypothetical protein QXX77_05580 [Candidatus Methanosuratincola sp.]
MPKKAETRQASKSESIEELVASLKPQIEAIKETLASFVSVFQALKSPSKVVTVNPAEEIEKIKVSIREELRRDLVSLEVSLARLDEKVSSMEKQLAFTDRLARLEERFDLLFEEHAEGGFHFEQPEEEDEEEYEDLPEPDEIEEDLEEPEED